MATWTEPAILSTSFEIPETTPSPFMLRKEKLTWTEVGMKASELLQVSEAVVEPTFKMRWGW